MMGLYINVLGKLPCLRCHAEAEARIQTKLFKVGFWNSANDYCVGDIEEIELSQLDDYPPLYDWDGIDDLVVVMGEWACSDCSLNWQFAKVILDISYSEIGCMLGSIKSISTFVPMQLQNFAGVHRVDKEFVLHGEFQTAQDWLNSPTEVCCARMLSGFQNWCREVAGVDLTG